MKVPYRWKYPGNYGYPEQIGDIVFCCEKMRWCWEDESLSIGSSIIFACNQRDEATKQRLMHGAGLAMICQDETEEQYMFIDYCPFCGEKIEVVEEGQESPVSKVVKE